MNNSHYVRNAELLKAYRAGDIGAREELILENSGLVKKIARRYSYSGKYEYDDLYQEGFIGMFTAIDKFDMSMDTSFSTYAFFWIKQSIVRYIHNTGRTIRLTAHTIEKITLLNKAVEELWKKLEREPSTYEIAKHMGISIYDVEKLKILKSDVDSLSRPVGEDGEDITLQDTIQDESDGPEELAMESDIGIRLRKAISRLNEKQQDTIKARYGIDQKQESQKEVGERLKITGSGVQYLEKQAIRKMRNMAELQEYKIGRTLDRRTNFYRQTEKVVMWRERERRALYEALYGDEYTMRL